MYRALLLLAAWLIPAVAWAEDAPTFYADSASGCRLGTFYPETGLTVRWSGPCAGGKAEGRGIAEWQRDGAFWARTEGEYHGGCAKGAVP